MSKYEKSSETYDAVYLSKKDYVKEAEQVHGIVQEQRKSAGNELLDVACGTGLHAEAFQRWYQVEGLDSHEMCNEISSGKMEKRTLSVRSRGKEAEMMAHH